jgi:mannosyltransferase OCH1-like enzyme
MIAKQTPGWEYLFFSDKDIFQFFKDNPLEEFADIAKKFTSFTSGAHRADLFRYYYLYVNGGFFMDSDAMIYTNIDRIVKDYDFVSVDSSCHKGTIFQGILGASKENPIIKEALNQAYQTDDALLQKEYHHFCRKLYDIIVDFKLPNIYLYDERRINLDGDYILDGSQIIFMHFWRTKTIPLAF